MLVKKHENDKRIDDELSVCALEASRKNILSKVMIKLKKFRFRFYWFLSIAVSFAVGFFCSKVFEIKDCSEARYAGESDRFYYEQFVGVWTLTEETRGRLDSYIRKNKSAFLDAFGKDNLCVNEYSMMLVHSGRHFRLYDKDQLAGVWETWPAPVKRVGVIIDGDEYQTNKYWKYDMYGNELLDSREIGYGFDRSVASIVWALKNEQSDKNDTDTVIQNKADSRKLVVGVESSYDMWGEIEFQVGLNSKGYYLTRTMGDGFGGLFRGLELEWRKIGGSP